MVTSRVVVMPTSGPNAVRRAAHDSVQAAQRAFAGQGLGGGAIAGSERHHQRADGQGGGGADDGGDQDSAQRVGITGPSTVA